MEDNKSKKKPMEEAETKRAIKKAIKDKCMDCSNQQREEVRLCPCKTCPLWPYRLGKVEIVES